MRAVVFNPGGPALADVPVPDAPDECMIRVAVAGICGTDLQLLEGYAGFSGIPGHEFVGVVERAPRADERWIGRRVVGEINVGCGRCDSCAAGIKEHCERRTVVGIRGRAGAFAEYMSLPASNLHQLPAGVADLSGVFVEPTAAACRILEQIEIGPSARVAVLGDGRMGLIVAQVLRTTGAAVVVLGRHREKLQRARDLDLDAALSSDAPVHAFDVVVDATGRPEGLTRALELARPRGTVVLKSTFHGETTLAPWPIVVNEVTIVGSRCGPFAHAIDLIARGHVRVAPLVSRVMGLEECAEAFAAARHELKVMFRL